MIRSADPRPFWVELAGRLAEPVLSALATGRMPPHLAGIAGVEAGCRTLAGLSPWLATQAPEALRDLAAEALAGEVLRFDQQPQSLVEAALLSCAMLRAADLWPRLDRAVQRRLIDRLAAARRFDPPVNNWLLFRALIEAFFRRLGEDHDRAAIDRAVTHHEQHHVGDGLYTDGFAFHADYYNSFVMHPMMLDVLEAVDDADRCTAALRRAQRAAVILERLISPEGAFPPIGRSLAYRVGAFHLLAHLALTHRLPEALPPGQVRSALHAVLERTMTAPGTFDDAGWLTVGFHGCQPTIGERYINRGSVYLCSVVLLPLGLPADDPFWADPPADWTARRLYAGQDLPPDHALDA